MNSPPDPGSPTYSASSDSGSPEELSQAVQEEFVRAAVPAGESIFTTNVHEGTEVEAERGTQYGYPRRTGVWENRESGRSQKDDLVDQHIVDELRIQFGDPFDDDIVRSAS
ncbi:hypothetical protein A0H81_11033 [Grifola frondosa]|uniref:Uncharacterized protein n=1 Tax=Grifola frondosa TaxID=5627 RepID=A0A1C7LVB2_GRIFR|nr:hypothetical protein A0H81_11033 [Grifola frondosa]